MLRAPPRQFTTSIMKYYDIGLNLVDPMFQGKYHSRQHHESDITNVLNRAYERNVRSALLTGSSIVESQRTIDLLKQYGGSSPINLYFTIGVHPCCANEFVPIPHGDLTGSATIDNPSNDHHYNQELYNKVIEDPSIAIPKFKELFDLLTAQQQANPDKFRAIGEIGLDYDRLHYACRELQLLCFEEQLKISCLTPTLAKKPLFLHMRSAADDFVSILRRFVDGFTDTKDMFNLKALVGSKEPIFYKFDPERKFVVHSFTDSAEALHTVLSVSPKNCYIGMNGASFRTMDNLEAVRQVPLDRLLLETDAPWCEIKRTHESFKLLERAKYPGLPYQVVKKEKLGKLGNEERSKCMVKGRNEPCTMEQVALVVATAKGIAVEEVADTVWKTTCEVYGE